MRYGHRGANQPVIDGDRVRITSQNHGFAVESPQAGPLAAHPSGAISADLENLIGAEVSVRTTNANDRTVEGLDVVGRPAFSVQFHPESRPGPHDAAEEFERFVEMIELVEVVFDAPPGRPPPNPRARFRSHQDRAGRNSISQAHKRCAPSVRMAMR